MTDLQQLANAHVLWAAGPDSAISDAHWAAGATLAELQSLVNYTPGVKSDGSNFNVSASDSVEDRSWADQAGAKSRGLAKTSGNIEVYTPGKSDTTSIYAQTHNAFGTPRTRLALMQRFIPDSSVAIAAGDEVNIFRVMTDDRSYKKTDASRSLAIGLVLQDNLLLNYIVPSAVPNPVTVTPSGALSVTMGTPKFLKATYEGRNVTIGAAWVSSNEAIFKVTPHGIIIPVAAGSANLSVTVPGSAAGSSIAVTVS